MQIPATRTLLDRSNECEVIDRLLDRARSGHSGALVLRGETGIGKTALLDYALESAGDMQVASVAGVREESALPFAGLHQLLSGSLDRIEELPPPQRDALGSAFGLDGGGGDGRDRFLTSVAALTLLSLLAADRPVLWTADDVELLDRPSVETLGFVSRRLADQRAALVFASAWPANGDAELPGVRELAVAGVSDDAARELFLGAAEGPVDEYVLQRVVGEAYGNPLALRAMSTDLTAGQLAGSEALPDLLPLAARLEQRLLHDIGGLPDNTRALLLLLAARRSTDNAQFWRAATDLGIPATAVEPAALAGLLRPGEGMAFRHPFTRAAIYGGAPLDERQRMHQALAAAADPDVNPDLRAWHLAAAADGPDEPVARELERCVGAAKRRGGYPATATYFRRAAELSPDRARRAGRLLAAASAELAGGHLGRAFAVLGEAEDAGLAGDRQQAHAQRLRGALALASGDNTQTSRMLLDAARGLARLNARLARETYLEALEAAMYAGHLDGAGGVSKTAASVRKAPRLPKSRMRGLDFLLDGYAALFTDGPAAATPALRRGIDLLRRGGDLRWLGLANLAAWEVWDEEAALALAKRRLALARRAGALAILPNALAQLGAYETTVGRFDDALTRLDDSQEAFEAAGLPGIIGRADAGRLVLMAWRGLEAETRSLAELCKREATARGQGAFVNVAEAALALLENSLGAYDAALSSATAALEQPALWSRNRALQELVEAAARAGAPETAAEAVELLEESTVASGTNWAVGVLTRSRALATDAEELYREAIEHLKLCRVTPELARSHLLYGEWLRRRRRGLDARGELRTALEMFVSMGAAAFAERARRELLASGERARRRTPATSDFLTPRERRVADLAAEGNSNAEIAAELFISPRTVEYHLRKVFRKLGVGSRTDLTPALLEAAAVDG